MIPHAGAMCLLDSVLEWDTARIRCSSHTHRDRTNPLRVDGRLPALCGIEYAAQAMAVHGRLTNNVSGRPRAGYLASLREVSCSAENLDELEGDLVVEAERLLGDEALVIYRFTLSVGGIEVLSGQAAVVLDAGGSAP
jgi:predicted hotdog family 3-hydroxylacyl-ACP dehydratase